MVTSTATHVLTVAAHAPLHVHLAVHHHHLRGASFGYAGLAAAAAASWIGLPGPGEPVLIAAGVLAAQHRLALAPVLLVAWLAATAGGVIGWAIGLKAGYALVTGRGPLRSMRLRAVARSEAMFASHPVLGVLLTPSWVAGIHRVRSGVYQPLNVASAAVWTAGIGVGAYLAGPAVLDVVGDVGTVTTILLGLLIAIAIAVEFRRRRRGATPPDLTGRPEP